MIKTILALLSIIACTAVLCGCGAKEPVMTLNFDEILYLGASLDDAIAFTEAPSERSATFMNAVSGALADPAHLTVARGLLQAREQQDGEVFRQLLHSESLGRLNRPDDEQMVHAMFRQVRNGEFLYETKEPPKYFVVQKAPQQTHLDSLFADSVAKPSTTLMLYQYNRPKDMLSGTMFFLAEEGGALKVFFPTRRMSAQPPPERDK